MGAAGGESVAENCQILLTKVNRFKANKEEVDTAELKGYYCDVNFTGIHNFLSMIFMLFSSS